MIEAVTLIDDGLYDDGALVLGLKLKRSALDRARKSGELKFSRRGGRVLYTGRWLQEWLTAEPAPDRTLAASA